AAHSRRLGRRDCHRSGRGLHAWDLLMCLAWGAPSAKPIITGRVDLDSGYILLASSSTSLRSRSSTDHHSITGLTFQNDRFGPHADPDTEHITSRPARPRAL